MRPILAWLVVALAPLACSSTGGGAGAADGDEGGLGQDATPTRDAPDVPDAADAPADSPADVPDPPACVSDAGASVPGDFANAPTCSPGTCVLAGTLNGTSIGQTLPLSSFAFANGTRFDATFGTGGEVHVTLATAVAQGQATAVVGSITLPSDGPLPGSNVCLGDGTELQFLAADAGQTIRFIGRCMSGSCTTTPTAMNGDLAGCCAH